MIQQLDVAVKEGPHLGHLQAVQQVQVAAVVPFSISWLARDLSIHF